jgi:cytidylate kinase
MARTVITIARSLGAGGDEIGRAVAESMDYRYVDNEIIDRAAERAGVSAESVARAERPPGLLARILDGIAVSATAESTVAFLGGEGTYVPVQTNWSPQAAMSYEQLIQQVIVEVANQPNVVIVAHGAGMCLAGRAGVLRVFATASDTVRAERLEKEAGMSARDAAKAVRTSDRARSEYLWRFYAARQEKPTHYDLVLNTDTLSAAEAVQLVAAAAKATS